MSLQKTINLSGIDFSYWKIIDIQFSRPNLKAIVTLGAWPNSTVYANNPGSPLIQSGYEFSPQMKAKIEQSNTTAQQAAYDAWYNANKDALSFNGLLDTEIAQVPADDPENPQTPTHDDQVATLELTRKVIPGFSFTAPHDSAPYDFTFDNTPLEAQCYTKLKALPDFQGALDV